MITITLIPGVTSKAGAVSGPAPADALARTTISADRFARWKPYPVARPECVVAV